MILRDRDVTVEPYNCDNMVGLVFCDLWTAIIFHLGFVYFDHNGRTASSPSTRYPRWPKCDCVNNKLNLSIDSQGEIPFFGVFCHPTAHRNFQIFKKAVLDFCGVQSLAEAKGRGRSIDCSFMRTVRSGTVESFCIRTQKQWENEMALLLERNSILQGMLTLALWITRFCIINYVRLLLAVGHSSNNGFCMHLRADRQNNVDQCKLLQKNLWVILKVNIFKSRFSIYLVDRSLSQRARWQS